MIKEFEAVRNWATIRGVGGSEITDQTIQTGYQRFLQEAIEIHEALVLEDEEEFQDAIGDTIVTLINLAEMKGYKAEDCLGKAFGVIELRKGLTTPEGSFVRYGKLSEEDKNKCDKLQGNPGDQYFGRNQLDLLGPDDFKG
jgi:NTP pyrophosphatase (non-canonical NTP hydrolase)